MDKISCKSLEDDKEQEELLMDNKFSYKEEEDIASPSLPGNALEIPAGQDIFLLNQNTQ